MRFARPSQHRVRVSKRTEDRRVVIRLPGSLKLGNGLCQLPFLLISITEKQPSNVKIRIHVECLGVLLHRPLVPSLKIVGITSSLADNQRTRIELESALHFGPGFIEPPHAQ